MLSVQHFYSWDTYAFLFALHLMNQVEDVCWPINLSSLKFRCRFFLFPIMYYYNNHPVRALPCPVLLMGPY
jgi:hypothetical protein